MTHLPFVAASYALAVLVIGGLSVNAWRRAAAAYRNLAAIDPRRGDAGPGNPRRGDSRPGDPGRGDPRWGQGGA